MPLQLFCCPKICKLQGELPHFAMCEKIVLQFDIVVCYTVLMQITCGGQHLQKEIADKILVKRLAPRFLSPVEGESNGAGSGQWGGGGGGGAPAAQPPSRPATQPQPPNRLATILCWALHFCILPLCLCSQDYMMMMCLCSRYWYNFHAPTFVMFV